MRRVLILLLATCVSLLMVAALWRSSVLAQRVQKDLPSSRNGSSGTAGTCADNFPTPFAAALNGKVTAVPNGSCNSFQPGLYPDYSVTLTPHDSSYTLTVTPILWENGQGGVSRQTILHLEFSATNPNLALKSFVIAGLTATNTALNPTYVACDYGQVAGSGLYLLPVVRDNQPGDTASTLTACTQPTMSPMGTTPGVLGSATAIQPTPVEFADVNTTRWDIDGLSGSTPLASVNLVFNGFPSDINPDAGGSTSPTNNLTQIFMAAQNNFLAVAVDPTTGLVELAGGLSIPVKSLAKNDSVLSATIVDAALALGNGFKDQVNASSATPGENGDGTPNNVPTPPDPVLPSACFDGGTMDSAPFRTLWYSFTPATDGTVTIDSKSSSYDTVMAMFTGSPGSLNLVNSACADDFTDANDNNSVHLQARLSNVPVTAHTPYFIMVGEVPPQINVLNDSAGNPTSPPVSVAAPLSNDATLFLDLTETPLPTPDFLVSASSLSPQSIPGIGTATSSITITPVNGFNQPINLACTVSPVVLQPPTCSLNPTSIVNGSGTAVLNVSIPSASATVSSHDGIFLAGFFSMGCPLILGIFRLRKGGVRVLPQLLTLLSLVYVTSCGGGTVTTPVGTQKGTYTVTVSAISGTLSHTVTVSLVH